MLDVGFSLRELVHDIGNFDSVAGKARLKLDMTRLNVRGQPHHVWGPIHMCSTTSERSKVGNQQLV